MKDYVDQLLFLIEFLNVDKFHLVGFSIGSLIALNFAANFQKKLNLWDIAAGIVILKEAGGLINEIDVSNTKDISIIASNSEINAIFREKLINF